MWLRHLLEEMGLQRDANEATILLGDNQQAGKWSREDMVTSGNRFIERQYYKRNSLVNMRQHEFRSQVA